MDREAPWMKKRGPVPDRSDALATKTEALEEAVDQIFHLSECVAVLLALVQTMANSVPPRPNDPTAELKVLGWLLSGMADPDDVSEIDASDWTSDGARIVWALAVEAIPAVSDGLLALPRRLAPWGMASVVQRMTDLALPHRRSEVDETIWRIAALGPVTERPDVEIRLVEVLGKRWSVIADAYAGVEQ